MGILRSIDFDFYIIENSYIFGIHSLILAFSIPCVPLPPCWGSLYKLPLVTFVRV